VSLSSPAPTPASILVVDDDRRVVELLTIALGAYGYRVLQAADGDEALRVASREHPDLVVLDVRLPRKSGYEVCERLRHDPDDPHVPIIMVSAAAETESRLQGLARGADDYLAKPFSPKELIARIRRLLARAAESRDARRRGSEAERELQGAREEARRSQAEYRGEQRLRELGRGFAWSFRSLLDVDALAARLLLEAQSQLGLGMAALLRAETTGEPLGVTAARGELPERIGGIGIRPGGELATLLAGLGRPVRLRELERFAELSGELAPFVAHGFKVLVPLRGPDGLEGVLAAGERTDGRDLAREDLELLAVLGESAALALREAGHCRAQAEGILEALAPVAARSLTPADRAAADEAALWCREAASKVLPSRERRLLAGAVRLASWACVPEGRGALERAAEADASGWCREVLRMLDFGRVAGSEGEEPAQRRRAVGLLHAALAYAEARGRGLDPGRAAGAARASAAALLDAPAREALAAPPPAL